MPRKRWKRSVLRDVCITVGVIALASVSCFLLENTDDSDAYAAMVFVLAVAVVARLTDGYVYGVVTALGAVLGVNYAFTKPYFAFSLAIPGYPLSFLCFLAVSILISTMTTQIKRQEERNYRAQLEEMRANLLRAVSHDLRTPLTSISGAANLLRQTPDMELESRQNVLAEIANDSQWLIRMVENLLSITRIQSEPARVRKEPQVAEEIVAEAVRKFHKRFPEMPVETSLPGTPLLVPMDSILIEQVLSNLLENAAIHAHGATHVRIRLSAIDNQAVFEVSDDGAGIPKKRLNSIFDSAGSRASDCGRNMGIGLSVCRAIILAHGGDICAGNRFPNGAYFRFYLPILEHQEEWLRAAMQFCEDPETQMPELASERRKGGNA